MWTLVMQHTWAWHCIYIYIYYQQFSKVCPPFSINFVCIYSMLYYGLLQIKMCLPILQCYIHLLPMCSVCTRAHAYVQWCVRGLLYYSTLVLVGNLIRAFSPQLCLCMYDYTHIVCLRHCVLVPLLYYIMVRPINIGERLNHMLCMQLRGVATTGKFWTNLEGSEATYLTTDRKAQLKCLLPTLMLL